MPTIAVCITSYNQIDYLKIAIDSVLAQTRKADQIIVVDDFSTDGSRELISNYKTQHPELFNIILNEKNLGVTKSRINALTAIKCDWVTFLDGDDRFHQEKIKYESSLIANGIDIIYSNHEVIDSFGEQMSVWAENDDKLPAGSILSETYGRLFPKKRLFRSEMVRWDFWKEVGFYDSNINLYEDYEMRIRLCSLGKAAASPNVLSSYRIHDHGLSQASLTKHIDVLEYILKKNRLLLNKLGVKDRNRAINGANVFLSKVARKSAMKLLEEGDKIAFKHARKAFIRNKTWSNFKLLLNAKKVLTTT